MNLSDLIEDCQVHLYDRLHLTDCFHLRATCPTLNASFFVYCRTLNSLVLKIGPNETATGPTDLVCPTLNRSISDFLLETFSSITHLTLELFLGKTKNPVPPEEVTYLLAGWSAGLVSMKCNFKLHTLWFREAIGSFSQILKIYIKQINKFPALRSLHFNCDLYNRHYQFNLPILGQLESFTLEGKAEIRNIYQSLIIYGMPNANLKTIQLTDIRTKDERELLFNLNVDNARKFTSMGMYFYMDQEELLQYAPKFTSLKYLCINLWYSIWTKLPWDKITATLARYMPELETLRMMINIKKEEEEEENPEDPDDPPLYTPLPSIKNFQMQFEGTIFHDAIRRHLNPARTLPNVVKVSIGMMFFNCIDCPDKYGDDELLLKCREAFEQPFTECPLLIGPVVHDDDDD